MKIINLYKKLPDELKPIVKEYGVINITSKEIRDFLLRQQDGKVKTSQVQHIKKVIRETYDKLFEQLCEYAQKSCIYQNSDILQLSHAFYIRLSRNKLRSISMPLKLHHLTVNRIYLSLKDSQLFNQVAKDMNMNNNSFLMYLLHVFLYGVKKNKLPKDDIFLKNKALFNKTTNELYELTKNEILKHFANFSEKSND